MGWIFYRTSRDQLIQKLIAPQETQHASTEVIQHTLENNVLWTVIRVTAKQAGSIPGLEPGASICYIGCHLLESSGNEWGYKFLDESMHPYHYSCPLHYLDLAPMQCVTWRARVHAFHEQRWASTAASGQAKV